jgi:outer membrane protein assembly factor BamA
MEIAVMAGTPAKRNMDIDARHLSRFYWNFAALINMAKVEVYGHKRMMLLLLGITLLPLSMLGQYRLIIRPVDKDSAFVQGLKLQPGFRNQDFCRDYISNLPSLLRSKGFAAASVDSVQYDSTFATVSLYVGESFHYVNVNTDSVDKKLLESVAWNRKNGNARSMTFHQVQTLQEKMLDYLENNGYPFAKITLDSIDMKEDGLYAKLTVDKGPLYTIDSIRNYGNARISSGFLQRHLSILNGSIYRKEKLMVVSKKLNELPYVQEQQPWTLTRLGSGSILDVYLDPKKSSQVNVLIGLLPNNSQLASNKMLVTGEATINLKNALGNGETIGLNWQQIQPKSPRLNLAFQQPYLFRSPFGISVGFDLFKKDSSFVNISMLLGVQYALSSSQSGSVFVQNLRTTLLTVDTFAVKNNRQLPIEADVSSVNFGVQYEFFNTDYRFNPRKGNEFLVTTSVGTKKVKKNNVIVKLIDESDPGYDFNSLYDTIKLNAYQFRVKGSLAHFFKLSKASTIKLAVNGGWFQSPNIFRNELFQIGGYKLLRGFDEESIFASQYAVGTAEFRYLLGQNSFLFSFADIGWAKNTAAKAGYSNNFLGAGLGMAFETKAGIFNISYAAGKRDDTKFNLRQAKIHLGYVNYF